MEVIVASLLLIVALYVGLRYGALEFRARRQFASLSPVLSKRTFLFTRADLLFHRLSEPVIISLTKKNLKVIHSLPFVGVRSVPLTGIKSLGMDTFLPWGSPLDKGRVVNVLLKDGGRLDFRITKDIESWRSWIQSFGFRA